MFIAVKVNAVICEDKCTSIFKSFVLDPSVVEVGAPWMSDTNAANITTTEAEIVLTRYTVRRKIQLSVMKLESDKSNVNIKSSKSQGNNNNIQMKDIQKHFVSHLLFFLYIILTTTEIISSLRGNRVWRCLIAVGNETEVFSDQRQR